MKKTLALCVGMGVLAFVCAPASATVVTFDDLVGVEAPVPNGYGGLNWDNFYYLDGVNYPSNPSGYQNGVVSPKNVAYNAWGNPAAFTQDPFNFDGVWLTAAWNDGLNIDIEGYLTGSLVYTQTVVANTAGPIWFQADYLNIDEVRFKSYGGTNHGYVGNGTHFAMDNLTYTVVPAPGAVLLVGLGAGLTGWLRRRRAL